MKRIVSVDRNLRRGLRTALCLTLLPLRVAATCYDADVGEVEPSGNGVRVTRPADDNLRVGDVIEQINSHLLRSCSDFADALSESRTRHLALLLLVRRQRELAGVVLRGHTADSVAKVASPPGPSPTPAQIGPVDARSVRNVLGDLLKLGTAMRASQPLLTPQPWVRQTEELRHRCEQAYASVSGLQAVAPIVGYYQTIADILVYKEKATHTAGYTRPQPNIVLGFHTGSQVSQWLRQYGFLEASIIAPPEQTAYAGWAEGNGRWLPDRAIELLIERAITEGGALDQHLQDAGSYRKTP